MQCLLLFIFLSIIKNISLEIVYPKIYIKENLIELDSFILELTSESDFLINPEIKWIGEDGSVFNESVDTGCDYKIGIVKGTELPSKVAVSVCDGKEVNGYIHFDNSVYMIQPSPNDHSVTFNGAHIIKKGKFVGEIFTTCVTVHISRNIFTRKTFI